MTCVPSFSPLSLKMKFGYVGCLHCEGVGGYQDFAFFNQIITLTVIYSKFITAEICLSVQNKQNLPHFAYYKVKMPWST